MSVDLDHVLSRHASRESEPPVLVEPADPYPYMYASLPTEGALVMAVGTVGFFPEPETDPPPVVDITATGATAGTPGSWTPADSTIIPADAASATAIVATPATLWAPGEYVAGTAEQMHWSGTAWVAGPSPIVVQEDAESAE